MRSASSRASIATTVHLSFLGCTIDGLMRLVLLGSRLNNQQPSKILVKIANGT